MTQAGAGQPTEAFVLDWAGLDRLIRLLAAEGRSVIGPTVRDSVVSYEPIGGVADLPRGVGDEQEPGRYRLTARGDEALFGYALAPASWKRHVYPARSVVFRATREGSGLLIEEPVRPRPRYAFIGVRSCEIAALAVLGGPLTQPNRVDPDFAASTEDLFVVAVSCGSPATTCFCTSAGTGPRAATGYDIRLAEIMGHGPTHFFAEAGSAAGAALLARMDLPAAGASDAAAAEDVTAVAVAAMGARVDLAAAPEVLARSHDHPRWEEVGERCLACGNCTMSCPTCFCVDVVDENPFDEDGAVRVREWSSCFGIPFSEMHGGVVRTSVSARYRQWLTHKMSSWVDQFGTLGCVGCGRCITMCPAGIDIRDELTAILATNDGAGAESS